MVDRRALGVVANGLADAHAQPRELLATHLTDDRLQPVVRPG
jgi:hypothetical protein